MCGGHHEQVESVRTSGIHHMLPCLNHLFILYILKQHGSVKFHPASEIIYAILKPEKLLTTLINVLLYFKHHTRKES